ncbi:hypothetical protein BH09PAT2_BH09PAT2_00990 [soil metagenome]
MKKILFIVGSNLNEPIGMRLCMEQPYGRTSSVEWNIVVYDEQHLDIFKKNLIKYDVIYEITTTGLITSDKLEDIITVSNIHTDTLTACACVHSPYIILDDSQNIKHSLRSMHLTGITLTYQKTDDAQYDYMRIKSDFLTIIHRHTSRNAPKQLYKIAKSITYEEQNKYNFQFRNFNKLDLVDKRLLSLEPTGEYIATFVNSPDIDADYYCYLNKKLRDVIHFDAWLQLSVKKTD